MSQIFVPRATAASSPRASSRAHAEPGFTLPDESPELTLPDAWTAPPRGPFPLVASVVPVVGAVALWLVTGSILALWLAALGPLIAIATMADAARGARSGRRRAVAVAERARAEAEAAVAGRHSDERESLRLRHPDVAGFAERPHDAWRAVPGRAGAVTLGSGAVASRLRVVGGEDDAPTAALRRRAAVLDDAPVVVPATTGVAVEGGPLVAAAVVRALALQLCHAMPPGELQLVGPARGETAWTAELPHRRVTRGTRLAVLAPDDTAPPDADIVLARVDAGAAPPACGAILRVDAPERALLDLAGAEQRLSVECIGEAQAHALANDLAERAERVLGIVQVQREVVFAELLAQAPPARRGSLPAVVGAAGGEPVVIDLVSDGPHAVVAGVTGSGKSELLITWILALSATHSTADVNFLLADFKGGTAFDGLVGLPHVTGVITDLDGAGARRAIESLRAEVRWREAELARAGARDVLDERVALPRLVIVVDEFAALLGEHPELHAVFSDVAARGRALGMHLILGTQRVSGVVRDALLTNCPLRVSLRVTDAADSRAVVGTDEAALLPGGAEGAGAALVRRAQDAAPRRARIALSTTVDVERISAAAQGPSPRRPWLPDLPRSVDLAGLLDGDGIVLGLADDPERQQQGPFVVEGRGLAVLGGPGAGKTTALETLASQSVEVLRVPTDGERAWDAVQRLVDDPPPPGAMIVIDDLDTLTSRVAGDHGHAIAERVERVVRDAGASGAFVAVAAQRLTGLAARVAEILPQRFVLSAPSRAEYVALGGEPTHHSVDAPPGRGRIAGRAVQVACPEVSGRGGGASVGARAGLEREAREHAAPRTAPVHVPLGGVCGLVARRALGRETAGAWQAAGVRIVTVDEAAADAGILSPSDTPVAIVGDPDEWQRQWRLLALVRDDHDLVIDASCGAEFRLLAGDRVLPPYCAPGRRRAWLIRRGGAPSRIAVPAAPDAAP